jgi:peptidoglycan/xylan/chitin deacetylase (PgdA/CDA1 family)
MANRDSSAAAMWSLVTAAESCLSEQERVDLSRELGRRLGVDYEEISRDRRLSLLTVDEIGEISRLGVDIELHTHRHCMPPDMAALQREIEENRAVLERATGRRALHLCYPSGAFSEAQWPTLRALDVRSGTTCEPGFNQTRTPALRLSRFLDSEVVTDIEFEAEMAGLLELLRRLRHLARRNGSSRSTVVSPAAYGH